MAGVSDLPAESRTPPTARGQPAAESAVVIRDLRKVYKGDVVANDGISLEIARGEIFGLLGPNGAGKTTLIQQIIGLLAPTSGSIVVEGVDVVRQPDRLASLTSYLPQQRVVMGDLEVDRALYITGRLRGLSQADAREQTEWVLDALGLQAERRKWINRLSGGLDRLAAFGRALVGSPRLLVLDEPTNELDPVKRRLVWDLIRQLNQERRMTVILVTHNVLEAERVIGRVGIVSRGKLVALGTPGDLKERLGDEVRIELLLRPHNGYSEDGLPPEIAALGKTVQIRPSHHVLFVRREAAGSVVDRALSSLGPRLDDFRVAPPTLEDVYIQLEGAKIE